MARDERKAILRNNEVINIETNLENHKELMLFLSFDITDSTKLKVQYPEKWSKIINILVNNKFPYMHYWKFNGDEMLYKRSINSLEFICGLIEKSYSHLKTLQTEMKEIIKEISVKATIWLALTETDIEHYKYNFSFSFDEDIDYVGKSIDEGFRLTKCSSMQKIAIDPKIVYILLDAYDYLSHPDQRNKSINFYRSKDEYEIGDFEEELNKVIEKIHLVGYSKCKGVWCENPYPVYWYYENTKSDDIKYNEHLNGEHLWPKKSTNAITSIKENEYENIYQIFLQLGIVEEIIELYQLLHIKGSIKMSSEGKANLYYMVACVNPQTNKVMIAKRSSRRKHLKNVWDFGNVKYQNINMEDTIEKEYKNTFGIDIELCTDANRGNNLIPYGYCTIYRNCKPHNSILCHAEIKNPNNLSDEDLIEYINDNKNEAYDEIRFVDANDIADFKPLTLDEIRIDSERAELRNNEPFPENTCIMYFENSIRGAIDERKKSLCIE